MGLNPNSVKKVISLAILAAFCGDPNAAMAARSAFIGVVNDPPSVSLLYDGISNPSGGFQINVAGNNPGYLNDITAGGANAGATGVVGILDSTGGATELVAAAVDVTDAAGASHSLSNNSDPALADIVNDLNVPHNSGLLPITAYAYDAAPEQYASEVALLSAGEVANGGEPFDILFAGSPGPGSLFPSLFWVFDFSDEIGNLDGITSLHVTDVGAIPEPTTASLMIFSGMVVLGLRPRS